METDAAGLNELAKGATHIYPIASRCGVFAKSDVAAAAQRRCGARGRGCLHLPGRCQPDRLRPRPAAIPSAAMSRFSGGPLPVPLRVARTLLRDASVSTRSIASCRITPPLRRHRCRACRRVGHVCHLRRSHGTASMASVTPRDPRAPVSTRLFATETDYEKFKARHSGPGGAQGFARLLSRTRVHRHRCRLHHDEGGRGWGESGELLYTWYDNNNGDVLGTARRIMMTSTRPSARGLHHRPRDHHGLVR